MSGNNGYVQFVDDDQGYLRWLAQNPGGFVVNSSRFPTSNYLKLHRASCKHINIGVENNWTTTGYIKTCSTDPATLDDWAVGATGSGLSPCRVCRPRYRPSNSLLSPRVIDLPPSHGTTSVPSVPVEVSPPDTGRRSIPPTISTSCPELDLAWASYAAMIPDSQIPIPDTEDDLNWHAFLGHSVDMQGFRAAEFAGVDPLTKEAPDFVPLRTKGIGVPELASLWQIPAIRDHLLEGGGDAPLGEATSRILRDAGGEVGRSLAEAFEHFPWRKFRWSVRALLQNSDQLRPFGFSFRGWLVDACRRLGIGPFPPDDFRRSVDLGGPSMPVESALREELRRAFYMVGPAMSAYMICDWQLWLWREGRTAVFATFKLDRFHEAFVKKFGRGVIPADEAGFARWWLGLFPELPPRLANECIWLAVEDKLVKP